MSASLWSHGLQHAKLPCPSLSPRVCSDSCPLSQSCYLPISSSVAFFSCCLQSFPASGSFPTENSAWCYLILFIYDSLTVYDVYHICVNLAIISCISSLKQLGPLVQNTPQRGLAVLLLDCFNCLNGAFRHWKQDSLQLTPPRGCVLVTVGMLSHWTKTFPFRESTASSAVKVLLEKIIPIWGTPLKLQNDRGPHFTGQLLPQVCTIWLVLQHFHGADQPRSSGLVKCTNNILRLSWKDLWRPSNYLGQKHCLLVLLNHTSTLFGTHKLSPFQTVKGQSLGSCLF